MKLWIGLLMAAVFVTAEEPKKKTAPKQESGKAGKRTSTPLTIPPDAEEVSPGMWRHKADGKTWIYSKTPFGVSRAEERPPEARQETKAAPKKTDAAEYMRAFDDGEYVRFERPGPFGVYKWRRKKAELDADERQVWERSQAGKTK